VTTIGRVRAKRGAIVDRRKATRGFVKHMKSASELASSHAKPCQPTAGLSFASTESDSVTETAVRGFGGQIRLVTLGCMAAPASLLALAECR
jgi:hypothetical protein